MKILLLIAGFCTINSWAQAALPDSKAALTIKPGEVRFVEFPFPKGDEIKLICRNQQIKYVTDGKKGQAFIMESYFSDRKPFTCKVTADNKTTYEIDFKVEKKKFPAEKLKVAGKRIKLAPKDEKRALAEQIVLNEIYASSMPGLLFDQPFMSPLNSHVTSIYGTKRVYNKIKKGQHLGIDFRAAIGDQIPAAGGGKVVFAGDLFYTGWTVIIDHGLDIFTVYGHLSKTLVKAGEVVKRGHIIALSGNTGRTSGPHLHWGVKVQGEYIDGFVLVEETKKHFRE